MSLRSLARTVQELGVSPHRARLVRQLPRFMRDLRLWRRRGGHVSSLYPVLTDWSDQAGSASGAYFHQDLLVARLVHKAAPRRHIDVGSRIDGFVAHLAVFREVEVLDIRPMHSRIHNIRFLQADLMKNTQELRGITDSLSCLHALEHFGLGRYGDSIDPQGHLEGFRSLVAMLQPGATLYLSFPIGRPCVEFNAHRVFSPTEVCGWPGSECLSLTRFDFVDDAGALHENVATSAIEQECRELIHGCGIYTFQRTPWRNERPPAATDALAARQRVMPSAKFSTIAGRE